MIRLIRKIAAICYLAFIIAAILGAFYFFSSSSVYSENNDKHNSLSVLGAPFLSEESTGLPPKERTHPERLHRNKKDDNECVSAMQEFISPDTELYAIASVIMQHESANDSNAVHFDKCKWNEIRNGKPYCQLNYGRTTKMGFKSAEEGAEFIYWAAKIGVLDRKKLNVGIGCMQVSFPYHFDKFRHWTEAFDPQKNVRAGLIILKGCMEKYKDSRAAIGCYNTQHPENQKPYLAKIWPQIEDSLKEMRLKQFAQLK